MQSLYLIHAENQRLALQELSLNAVVTKANIRDDGVRIQIERTEHYQDGQSLHNCELIFKGERDGIN